MCLELLLVSTVFELHFKERSTECSRYVQVCLTRCIVREMFTVRPRREATLRSVNIFCELCNLVNRLQPSSCACRLGC